MTMTRVWQSEISSDFYNEDRGVLRNVGSHNVWSHPDVDDS